MPKFRDVYAKKYTTAGCVLWRLRLIFLGCMYAHHHGHLSFFWWHWGSLFSLSLWGFEDSLYITNQHSKSEIENISGKHYMIKQGTSSQYQYCYLDLVNWYWDECHNPSGRGCKKSIGQMKSLLGLQSCRKRQISPPSFMNIVSL